MHFQVVKLKMHILSSNIKGTCFEFSNICKLVNSLKLHCPHCRVPQGLCRKQLASVGAKIVDKIHLFQ